MKFCPSCKSKSVLFDGIKKYSCKDCGWEFFQNTASAVAGLLEFKGKVMAVRRNCEPGKGLLDFPGGFVDPDESAEQALKRELNEELGISVNTTQFRYIGSSPNTYLYKGTAYKTCDLFFTVRLSDTDFQTDKKEIMDIEWFHAHELNPADFAFTSMHEGIRLYQAQT